MTPVTKRDEGPGHGSKSFASYADFYAGSTYSNFQHEVRRGGSYGIQVLRVDQGAHSLTDIGTPDLLIGVRRKIEPRPARYHLGDRWIDIDTRRPLTVVAPPQTDVHYDIGGDNSLIILAIPINNLPDLPETDRLVERLAEVYETPFDDPLLTDLAERFWQESVVGDTASTLFMDSGVMATLSLLLGRARGPLRAATPRPQLAPAKLQRILDFIEAHLADDVSLDDLAAVACLSPFHFGRIFKASVGVSPLRYVVDRRIAKACTLLADPAISMLSISLQCGFADSSHFSTVFRKHRNASPSAWRQAHHGWARADEVRQDSPR